MSYVLCGFAFLSSHNDYTTKSFQVKLVVFAGLFHEVPKIIFYYPPAIDPVKILSNERSHSLSLLPAAHIR